VCTTYVCVYINIIVCACERARSHVQNAVTCALTSTECCIIPFRDVKISMSTGM